MIFFSVLRCIYMTIFVIFIVSSLSRQYAIPMTQKNRRIIQYSSLAAVFTMMCVMQLWYTLLIVFSFAVLLTLVTRRRGFCANHCPMGTIQDVTYRKHALRNPGLHRFLHKPWVRYLWTSLFWGAVVLSIFFTYQTPGRLWGIMFSIMAGSAVTAVILQSLTRKRAWCSTVCPYGTALDAAAILRRRH